MSWPPKDVILRQGEAAPKDVRLRAYPGVATLPAYDINDVKATLPGQIEAITPFDTRGFDWGTQSGVYTKSWAETGSFGTGSYSHVTSDLQEYQRYYFRAKVHGSLGWFYGSEMSFIAILSPIDLRFSDVEPPLEDPPRTIYSDLPSMPDPMYLGLCVRYYNYDDVGLYFRIDGEGTNWTFNTVNLGLLGSGSNAYALMDNFAHRPKPAAAVEETVKVRLRAYTDAAYTNLKWTYERIIDVIFIDSNDGSWTIDMDNDFDDGTKQGWDGAGGGGYNWDTSIVTDYVLSAPYSIRIYCNHTSSDTLWYVRFYKTVDTPNRNHVYAIANVRHNHSNATERALEMQVGGVRVLYAGLGSPDNRWVRVVFLLPKNASGVLINIGHRYHNWAYDQAYLWMDDFLMISKD